jgi:hypothetical protein
VGPFPGPPARGTQNQPLYEISLATQWIPYENVVFVLLRLLYYYKMLDTLNLYLFALIIAALLLVYGLYLNTRITRVAYLLSLLQRIKNEKIYSIIPIHQLWYKAMAMDSGFVRCWRADTILEKHDYV